MKLLNPFRKHFALIIAFAWFHQTTSSYKIDPKEWALHIVFEMFGPTGTGSSLSHREEIGRLVTSLMQASEYQKILIAQCAAQRLDKTMEDLSRCETSSDRETQFLQFIYAAQKGYLEEYAEQKWPALPWWQRWQGRMMAAWNALCGLFSANSRYHVIEQTAADVDFYAHFEAEHIFTNYHTTLVLFSQQKAHPFPPLLLFWQHPILRTELLRRVKEHEASFKLQAAALAGEVAGEVAVTAGEEMVEGGLPILIAEQLGEAAAQAAEEVAAQATVEGAEAAAVDTLEKAGEGTAEQAEKDFLSGGEEAAEENAGKETAEEEPEKTRAEKRAEFQEAARAQLKDPAVSTFTKAYVGTKLAISIVLQKTGISAAFDAIGEYILDPIGSAYKTYIFDTMLAPLEGNALETTLDKVPGWLRPIVDMTLQMTITLGGGIVTAWISAADQKIYMAYAAQQKQMAAINTSISTEFSLQKAQKLKAGFDAFKAGRDAVSQGRSNQAQLAIAEKSYREQSIISTPASDAFTVDSLASADSDAKRETTMQVDQRFALAAMITPDLAEPQASVPPLVSRWYNLFRSGNWQYLPSGNSFCQMQVVKIAGTTPIDQATQALYNSIFRDYVPAETTSYTITVDCTIISCDATFLVGIIFNNARWISGVPDRYHQHRFAGIFGSSATQYLVLEESKPTTDPHQPSTAWPAYLIFSQPTNYQQPAQQIPNPTAFPVTYRITITTEPTKATTTLSAGTTVSVSAQRETLQSSVFGCHGIGFMAAGCNAQFKLIEPSALTYTDAQVDALKKFLSS